MISKKKNILKLMEIQKFLASYPKTMQKIGDKLFFFSFQILVERKKPAVEWRIKVMY